MTSKEAQGIGAIRARFTSTCGWCGSRIVGRRADGAASWIVKLPARAIGVSHAASHQQYVHADCYDDAIKAAGHDR